MSDIILHGFAAALMNFYKNKIIEVNTGEIKTTHIMDQFQHEVKHLIRGELIDAFGDAIMLRCLIKGGTKDIMINCWSINSVVETETPGSLTDVYRDSNAKK